MGTHKVMLLTCVATFFLQESKLLLLCRCYELQLPSLCAGLWYLKCDRVSFHIWEDKQKCFANSIFCPLKCLTHFFPHSEGQTEAPLCSGYMFFPLGCIWLDFPGWEVYSKSNKSHCLGNNHPPERDGASCDAGQQVPADGKCEMQKIRGPGPVCTSRLRETRGFSILECLLQFPWLWPSLGKQHSAIFKGTWKEGRHRFCLQGDRAALAEGQEQCCPSASERSHYFSTQKGPFSFFRGAEQLNLRGVHQFSGSSQDCLCFCGFAACSSEIIA